MPREPTLEDFLRSGRPFQLPGRGQLCLGQAGQLLHPLVGLGAQAIRVFAGSLLAILEFGNQPFALVIEEVQNAATFSRGFLLEGLPLDPQLLLS